MFNYKVFVAEFIGTFALVFVGSAAGIYGQSIGLLGIALAHGLTLAVFVYVYGHISGTHVNPAVTFGLTLNGTVKWSEALVYWVAQFTGALFAAFFLRAFLTPLSADAFAGAATTGALTDKYPYYAVAVEALLTFFLVNTVLHTAVAGKAGPFAGWAIGTTLVIAILAGGPLTGASLNPARTFGPAVFTGAFQDGMTYLIYFAGPLLGAAIAVGAFRLLNSEAEMPDESEPEFEFMNEEALVVEEPKTKAKPAAPPKKPAARKTTRN